MKSLSILALMIIVKISLAQSGSTTSIQADSARIMDMTMVAWNLKFSDPDSAELIAKGAIELASKHHETNLSGYCYKTLGVIYAIGGKTDNALAILNKAYESFKTIPDEYNMAMVNMIISTVYRNMGDYQNSLLGFDKSLTLFTKLEDKKGIADCNVNIANTFIDISQPDTAIKCLIIASKIYDDLADTLGMAVSRLNRGNALYTIKNYTEAIRLYNESLPLFEKLNSHKHIGLTLNNIAAAYKDLKKFQQANKLIKRAITIRLKQNDIGGLGSSYDNLAQVFQESNSIDSAIYYYEKSLKYRQMAKDWSGISSVYNNLAVLMLLRGDLTNAELLAKKSLSMGEKNGSIQNQKNAYKVLAEIYSQTKQFQWGYRALQKYIQFSDSIYNTEKTNTVANLNIRYQTEIKQSKIIKQKILIDNQQLKLKYSKYSVLIVVIGSIFLIGLILFLWWIRQKRIENELQLFKSREELAVQKYSNLFHQSQMQAIREKISGQEEERTRIARELHDGIGGTLAAVKMRLEKVNHQPNPEDMASLVSMVASSWEEVRTISHNLMPPQFEEVSVDRVLQNHVRELNKSNKTDFTIQFLPKNGWEKIPAELQVELYRVVQELCTNIIKYSNATTVEIQLSQLEGSINLTMEDNGAPFIYSSKGIGYRNLQERIKLLNGSFEKNTGDNQGNTYLVQIPFAQIKA